MFAKLFEHFGFFFLNFLPSEETRQSAIHKSEKSWKLRVFSTIGKSFSATDLSRPEVGIGLSGTALRLCRSCQRVYSAPMARLIPSTLWILRRRLMPARRFCHLAQCVETRIGETKVIPTPRGSGLLGERCLAHADSDEEVLRRRLGASAAERSRA